MMTEITLLCSILSSYCLNTIKKFNQCQLFNESVAKNYYDFIIIINMRFCLSIAICNNDNKWPHSQDMILCCLLMLKLALSIQIKIVSLVLSIVLTPSQNEYIFVHNQYNRTILLHVRWDLSLPNVSCLQCNCNR